MEKGVEREKNLSLDDYLNDGYFTKHQWESYLFQINTVRKLVPVEGDVLEIGCGGGIVRTILAHVGYNVETLDINENLRPTYTADISLKSFGLESKYDCVICSEVLEHIPKEAFETCLKNIAHLSKKYVILTLPNCKDNKFEIEVIINHHRRIVCFGTKVNKIAPMHYWELNSEECCTNAAISAIVQEYFSVIEEGVMSGNKYHYYYILEK